MILQPAHYYEIVQYITYVNLCVNLPLRVTNINSTTNELHIKFGVN